MNDQQRGRAQALLPIIAVIGGFLAGIVFTLEQAC